jgi:hypothetical protein
VCPQPGTIFCPPHPQPGQRGDLRLPHRHHSERRSPNPTARSLSSWPRSAQVRSSGHHSQPDQQRTTTAGPGPRPLCPPRRMDHAGPDQHPAGRAVHHDDHPGRAVVRRRIGTRQPSHAHRTRSTITQRSIRHSRPERRRVPGTATRGHHNRSDRRRSARRVDQRRIGHDSGPRHRHFRTHAPPRTCTCGKHHDITANALAQARYAAAPTHASRPRPAALIQTVPPIPARRGLPDPSPAQSGQRGMGATTAVFATVAWANVPRARPCAGNTLTPIAHTQNDLVCRCRNA